jgi:hypothetical protein
VLSHSAFGRLFILEHIAVTRLICNFDVLFNIHTESDWPFFTVCRET